MWVRRAGRVLTAAAIALAFPTLEFDAPAAADYPGSVHTDDQVRRFTNYQGPVRSEAILRIWREGFLGQRFNRAIAISPDGSYGTAWGWDKPEDAADHALSSCRSRSQREQLVGECRLYATDMSIVYPGLEYEVPKLNVSFGSSTLREDYFWYGPQRAKGVIVWSHGTFTPGGTCVDQRQSAAWAFITRFNLDGWDVLRFDRDPCFDTMPRAQLRSRNCTPLGTSGSFLPGNPAAPGSHSRCCRCLEYLLNVSAVIGVSPAEHGTKVRYVTEQGWGDWTYLIDHLDVPQIAIVLIPTSIPAVWFGF
jgi:hypothetical protein